MSLSFVSKSIQTSRDDGGYDETPIESKDGDDGGSGAATSAKPLFDQLRANMEQEEAEREEFQRALMRGTLALDDDDCAHLDSLEREKQRKLSEIRNRTEEELAAYRAAKADRNMLTTLRQEEDGGEETHDFETYKSGDGFGFTATTAAVDVAKSNNKKPRALVPKILVKRKKRRIDSDGDNQTASSSVDNKKDSREGADHVPEDASKKGTSNSNAKQRKQPEIEEETSKKNESSGGGNGDSGGGIGGLLAGYGSSSDDDDDE